MRKAISIADLLKLSVSKRIQLVEDVWDSIANVPQSVSLTDEQKKKLENRLAAYHRNPAQGSPWTDVKKRILSSR